MGEEAAATDTGATPPVGRYARIGALLALIRNAALTLALLVCLLHPSTIGWFLDESRLSELSGFGFTLKAKEAVQRADQERNAVSAQVAAQAAASPGAPPAEASRRPVDAALSDALKTAERLAPDTRPLAGWLYLGHADAEMRRWQEGDPVTTSATLPLPIGTDVTVTDEVYLRDVNATPPYSAAKIQGIARIGDKLTVVAIDSTPATPGGKYVWAKVGRSKR